jgi:hypothetical protein
MKLNLILPLIFIWSNVFAQVKSDSVATERVDRQTYKVVYDSSGNLPIYSAKNERVLFVKANDLYLEGFWRLKFQDFNNDGFKDIIIGYYSNVPAISDLILYDPHTRKFVQIKDFSDYPDAIRLKGTNLFYSYHRSGCADNNWDSDLFKVVKFKIVRIGNISGRTCVDPPDKPGIYVSKLKGKRELLFEKFAINKPADFKDCKWGFIEWYWKNNYTKFSE